MTEAEEKMAALLASLWIKVRPVVEERLDLLDQAAAAADRGTIPEDLRQEAQSSAHKLAGSLGMYGYDKGTEVARVLEVTLNGSGVEAGHLRELVGALRAAVFPNG